MVYNNSMKKQFYAHLVQIETLHIEIDSMDLTEEEKNDLKNLINSNFHHSILDTVLSELQEEDKKKFLEHFTSDDHEKIWEHLKSKTAGIEEKIKSKAEKLKEEFLKDIKEAKEKKTS